VAGVISYGGPGSKYNDRNEDSGFVVYRGGNGDGELFLGVVDGAGGMSDGYLAGRAANEAMRDALAAGQDVRAAVAAANEAIVTDYPEGAAATAVVRISTTGKIHLTAVGDAQGIVIRDGAVLAATELQNWPALLFKRGAEGTTATGIYTDPRNYLIFNALGSGFESHSKIAPTSHVPVDGKAGDYVILYSDGVTDVISPYELAKLSEQ
jgi:serine/threonine protein phosphatase PrpC